MRLLEKRYEEIKQAVADLYKNYNICQYPIDVFELCKKMNIELFPYTSLSPQEFEKMYSASPDGLFSEYINANSIGRIIFYNNTMIAERIRFTILHEIGHIVLV